MKKLAFAAMLIGATGLLACGGDDDGDGVIFPDSGPGGDGGPAQVCNPVAQTGCEAGEKCTWLVVSEDPFLGRVDCVPDGTVEIGGACTRAMPGEDSTVDDCKAGGLCISGTCREICSINPESCGEGFSCARYVNTFSDDNTGVCDQICNPVTQDCPQDGQGCYLDLGDGIATCSGVPEDAAELMQGDPCLLGQSGESCYLNGCAEGYASVPAWAMGEMPTCTAYCSPVSTYLDDPEGDGTGNLVGRALGAEGLDCSAGRIGASGHQCRFFQSIPFSDGYLDYVSADYGFCANTGGILWGDCEEYSPNRTNAIYDGAGGGESGRMAVQEFCVANPAECPYGCADLATEQSIYMAWCEGPGNGQPSCAMGARSKIRSAYLTAIKKRFDKAGVPFPVAIVE